jgi:hypothetical protein
VPIKESLNPSINNCSIFTNKDPDNSEGFNYLHWLNDFFLVRGLLLVLVFKQYEGILTVVTVRAK